MNFQLFFFYPNSPISKEQRSIENALIMFCIKDQDLFGISNKYVAEGFVTFEQIARTGRLEQMHLKLSRPTVTGLFNN